MDTINENVTERQLIKISSFPFVFYFDSQMISYKQKNKTKQKLYEWIDRLEWKIYPVISHLSWMCCNLKT